MISVPCGPPLRHVARSAGLQEVDGRLTLDHTDLMIEAALKGVGLTYVTEWMAAEHAALSEAQSKTPGRQGDRASKQT
jgi:DNA-binding transcriptional LysR family regulator